GLRDAQLLEVRRDVGRAVAAAQLDQRDALAAAVGIGRKIVELGELRRRERGVARVRARGARGLAAGPLEVRAGGGPVVDAEDAFDQVRDVRGDGQLAGAPSIGAALALVVLDLRAERRLELRGGTRE